MLCVCVGYAVAQWLGLYLQLLGVAMVAGVSFLAVLEHHFSSVDPGTVHFSSVDPGTVSLLDTLTYICNVTLCVVHFLSVCIGVADGPAGPAVAGPIFTQ